MDIIKYDVYRGPNLGVYISVNDNVALIPLGFAESKAEK
ncbi:MAG TPA: translation initiation factor 6, partial [Nitrosopumilus sp.]|nr:translation initiation factor 6 [Nitrosopumilus sp.]